MYFEESFSADEQAVLSRYFTNIDRPVFALINLPEVVKGALFARYSRTHKSLRRLLLDEFLTDADQGIEAIASQLEVDDQAVATHKAEALYNMAYAHAGS